MENVPKGGAVIFVGNHPNSLIDPIVVVASSPRKVHFAAKDVLFESRTLRVFLNALGAIPIRRRVDHPDAELDNLAAFEALHRVLEGEGAIGIFPEGVSHDESQLRGIKTGAARIALGLCSKRPDLKLIIVPIGLNYTHPQQFRSQVLIQFGPGLAVDSAWHERYQKDEVGSVRALTDAIEERLKAITINAPDWETLHLLDGVRRLYQPPKIPLENRIELARRFNRAYPDHQEDPEVRQLLQRVKMYQERLDDIDLSDEELRREIKPAALLGAFAKRCLFFCLWLPLAAPGFVIHAPMGLAAGWGGNRFTPRKDVVATTKLVMGAGIVLLFCLGILLLAFHYGGIVGGLIALALFPLSGYATIRVLERTASLRRLLRRVKTAFVLGKEVWALRQIRADLQRDIIDAVQRKMPDDLVPLYTPDTER